MPFKVIRQDIVKVKADAIVNTANPMPRIGGGTDYAIYYAAGEKELLAEREKIGKIARGQAVETKAFKLNAKYIIHTVGPLWVDGTMGEDDTLRSCYINSLQLADELGCKSIAFPLISTGIYGFPKDRALRIVNDTIAFFLEHCNEDMMVYLVLFGSDAHDLAKTMFADVTAHIGNHYVETHLEQEYEIDNYRRERNVRLPREEEQSFDSWSYEAYRAEIDEEESDSFASPLMSSEIESSELPVMSSKPLKNEKPKEKNSAKSSGIFKESIFKSSEKKASKSTIGGSIGSLDDFLANSGETFQQMLLRLIDESGMSYPDVYKKALIDKKLFSKIKNNEKYKPNRNTVMQFALALELNLDQATDLMASAGFAFSPAMISDQIVMYHIRTKKYSIYDLEVDLSIRNLAPLCNYGA